MPVAKIPRLGQEAHDEGVEEITDDVEALMSPTKLNSARTSFSRSGRHLDRISMIVPRMSTPCVSKKAGL